MEDKYIIKFKDGEGEKQGVLTVNKDTNRVFLSTNYKLTNKICLSGHISYLSNYKEYVVLKDLEIISLWGKPNELIEKLGENLDTKFEEMLPFKYLVKYAFISHNDFINHEPLFDSISLDLKFLKTWLWNGEELLKFTTDSVKVQNHETIIKTNEYDIIFSLGTDLPLFPQFQLGDYTIKINSRVTYKFKDKKDINYIIKELMKLKLFFIFVFNEYTDILWCNGKSNDNYMRIYIGSKDINSYEKEPKDFYDNGFLPQSSFKDLSLCFNKYLEKYDEYNGVFKIYRNNIIYSKDTPQISFMNHAKCIEKIRSNIFNKEIVKQIIENIGDENRSIGYHIKKEIKKNYKPNKTTQKIEMYYMSYLSVFDKKDKYSYFRILIGAPFCNVNIIEHCNYFINYRNYCAHAGEDKVPDIVKEIFDFVIPILSRIMILTEIFEIRDKDIIDKLLTPVCRLICHYDTAKKEIKKDYS